MRSFFLTTILVLASASGPTAAPMRLAPYRAQYEVTLAHTQPGSIVAAHGRTVVEFRDVCSAWTMAQRFITDMTDARAHSFRSDFYVSSSETKDGREMRFRLRDIVDGKTTERFDGTGTLADAGGQVRMTSPRGHSFVLPAGTAMPAQFTLLLLRAAQHGSHSVRQTVFQGGDSSDLYDAVGSIGAPMRPQRLVEDRAADITGMLKGVAAWPAIISYYPHSSQDRPADYELAYRLYANGVISQMSLIYPTFTLQAELVRLEPLPSNC